GGRSMHIKQARRIAAVALAASLALVACGGGDDGGDGSGGGDGEASGGIVTINGTEPQNPLIPTSTNEVGGVPIVSSSGRRRACLVEGAVAEHGVQDVDAVSGQADERGVVLLAGGAFAVVVGA